MTDTNTEAQPENLALASELVELLPLAMLQALKAKDKPSSGVLSVVRQYLSMNAAALPMILPGSRTEKRLHRLFEAYVKALETAVFETGGTPMTGHLLNQIRLFLDACNIRKDAQELVDRKLMRALADSTVLPFKTRTLQ